MKEEASVPLQRFILGHQKGLRGHSPKWGTEVIEADVLHSASLLITCVQMGESLCLLISSSVTWGEVGSPRGSFEGLRA